MALGDGGQTKKKTLPQQERATEEDGGVDRPAGRLTLICCGRVDLDLLREVHEPQILRHRPPMIIWPGGMTETCTGEYKLE